MTECILWSGRLDKDGYGLTGRHSLAHRVAYIEQVGPIPDDLTIDHLCRVRSCVNVLHMEIVTTGENTRRGLPATKTRCSNGHAFDEENTYFRPSGGRQCRACNREAARLYQSRKHHKERRAA